MRTTFGVSLTVTALVAMLAVYMVFLVISLMLFRRQRVSYVVPGGVRNADDIAGIQTGVISHEHPGLTERELDVLRLLLRNYPNVRIAETLMVSDNTVKTHIKHIYEKVGINSRAQLFEIAQDIVFDQGSAAGK